MAKEFDRDQFRWRLQDALAQIKIGTSELAQLTDTKRETVRLWKSGSAIPNTESLFRLCSVTGLSADWLLGLRP